MYSASTLPSTSSSVSPRPRSHAPNSARSTRVGAAGRLGERRGAEEAVDGVARVHVGRIRVPCAPASRCCSPWRSAPRCGDRARRRLGVGDPRPEGLQGQRLRERARAAHGARVEPARPALRRAGDGQDRLGRARRHAARRGGRLRDAARADLVPRRAVRVAQGTLWRISGGRKQAIVRKLPFGLHQQDNVVPGPDGRLYFGSGSTCDACAQKSRLSAAILSVRPDGSDLRVVASGLRNPFGLAFDGSRLYVSVNNRDKVPAPAETLVRIRQGAFYGWPRCWASEQKQRDGRHVRGRDEARRLPRAALLRGRARRLPRPLVRPRVPGQRLHRALGRVPDHGARPPRRPRRASTRPATRARHASSRSRPGSTTRSRSPSTATARCSSRTTGAASIYRIQRAAVDSPPCTAPSST